MSNKSFEEHEYDDVEHEYKNKHHIRYFKKEKEKIKEKSWDRENHYDKYNDYDDR